jgi:putative transcriptional regulator
MKNDLASLRLAKNISQEALAKTVGVSRQTVISIEKGRFSPNLGLAFRLAKFFDCSIEAIFEPDLD